MAYITFDIYSETTGREVVSNFLKTNGIEIQQGNLIKVLHEGQTFLFSSKFITGITLYDTNTGEKQISLGDNFDFTPPGKFPEGELVMDKVGFLHSHLFYFIENKNFLLAFEVKSVFLRKFFALFTLALGIVLGFVIFVIRLVQKGEEQKRMEEIFEMGKQLRHDISSAMHTVVVVAQNPNNLPSEDRRSLVSLYDRIDDILQDLDFQNPAPETLGKIPLHFSALIKDIYHQAVLKNSNREKIKWRLNLSHDYLDLCLGEDASASDLSRCLHNLIDNAVQSIEGAGEISLSLQQKDEHIVLKIEDTGVGIHQDDLKKLGTQGFSKKERGQGLGVYHAKKCVEGLGGSVIFESILQRGTTVTLNFPYHPPPSVYRLKKRYFEQLNYINVDDDPSVHLRMGKSKLWRNENARVKCYSSFPERSKYDDDTFFLIDYDLRDPTTNGIKLIKQHGLEGRALLVTGHYSDPEIVKRCMQERIKILPKILL